MYKLIYSLNNYSIQYGNLGIPSDPANTDYQRFIQDVAEQGIQIVTGPDIHEPDYRTLRQAAYPSLQDQQDMQYWDGVNGTTVWQDTIASIKTKYLKTITGGITVGEVPIWVQESADNWAFNKQLSDYIAAIERLSHYVLAEGRPELREDIIIETKEVWNEETREMETVNITQNVITQTAIEPLEATVEVTTFDPETMESVIETVRNPAIVRDEQEREVATAVVDATPQEVIDAIAEATEAKAN